MGFLLREVMNETLKSQI